MHHDPMTAARESISFVYRNWRGEVAERGVVPLGIRFGATEWHPQEQWLMDAFDLEKQAERTFAILDIIAFNDGRRAQKEQKDG